MPLKIMIPLLIIGCFASCKTIESNRSEIKHDVGDPSAFGAFDYIEVRDEDYIRSVPGQLLPMDHALVRYSQSLVDHLDRVIRSRYATQMNGIPSPKIAVRKTDEVGAFTMDRQRVCYEVPVRISADIIIRPDTRLQAIEPYAGKITPSQLISCRYKIPIVHNHREDFARWFSRRFAPCSMSYRRPASDDPDESGLALTGPCREADFFPQKSVAGGIVTNVAPNRLLLFSGIFAALGSEDELVAVIAHELGHYYRAHVAGVRPYNYCYRISPENHGHRPIPDPSLDDLCGALRPRINFSIEEATKRQLGYYTIEQEADEIALEFLALAGIPPTAAVNAWFNLSSKLNSRTTSKPAIPMDECLRLRQNNWLDEKGQQIFVPVGDYRESHHSWCYRIRNLEAEIAAHKYVIQPRTIPVTNWKLIQQQATSL